MKWLNIKYIDTGSIIKFWRTGKQTIGNCARCGRFSNLDPHHTITQSRGGIDTVKVCRVCHNWIGENIALAEKEGFYIRGYKHGK